MPSPAQYSDCLSDEERAIGFQLIEVCNQNEDSFSNDPEKVLAVVYRINSTDRVVKLSEDLGGGYQIERYGRFNAAIGPTLEADWKPGSPANRDLREAMRIANGGEQVIDYLGRITPTDPGSNY